MFDELDKEEKAAIRVFFKYAAIAVAGIAVISTAAWGIDLALTPVKGAADVVKQNYSAENQIAASQTWSTSYKDVQKDQANVSMLKSQLAASPGDTAVQNFLTDAKSVCNDDVTHYNTLQDQPTIKDWKPASVPATVDLSICN